MPEYIHKGLLFLRPLQYTTFPFVTGHAFFFLGGGCYFKERIHVNENRLPEERKAIKNTERRLVSQN